LNEEGKKMVKINQKAAAKKFKARWKNKGNEKSDTQQFWMDLLVSVFGVEDITNFIDFESPVILQNKSFMDAYIPSSMVLIEQKSSNVNLDKKLPQSDGSLMTPFEQAKKYVVGLPRSKHPRWIVVSNFREIRIHDMEKPNEAPQVIWLDDLETDYYRLSFLLDEKHIHTQKEKIISINAGEIVGVIYNALEKQYKHKDQEDLRSLNILCVRLVFLFYAEDAEVLGRRLMFHDYMEQFPPALWREKLIQLFQVLDTPVDERDEYLADDLLAFPYVNGGLFAEQSIIIPNFNEEIVDLVLNKASLNFDWSQISPTIFGGVFESTLNPDTRRSGGMHYTSIENIHKVIDPLFMNGLKEEFKKIKEYKQPATKIKKLEEYQKKLSELVFLDPACGSGNFLTETFLALRRLENEILKEKIAARKNVANGQIIADLGGEFNPIQISISQFYGIEINDFAVAVAKAALWIAESQMIKETEDIVLTEINFLPLKTNANIVEGNALRMNWNEVVPKEKLSFLMGNPPFVGGMYMSESQKYEIRTLFDGVKNAGEFDYVAGWYLKAAQYIYGTKIISAFVSTNSICQGSSVITFWKYLYERYNIQILFAHQTFIWNNESIEQAKVHCVIIGFASSAITSNVIKLR